METGERDRPLIWLVIEDWCVRSLIVAQLEEDGFEVRASLSCPEALLRLEGQSWARLAAIVVDVAAGVADDVLGPQLAVLADHAAVVALTGSFGPAPAYLWSLGVRTVLRRPISVGEVCCEVWRLVESAPVRA